MKQCILLICIQLLVFNIDAQEKKNAEILVDLKQQSKEISPLIYGQFIEFLGKHPTNYIFTGA